MSSTSLQDRLYRTDAIVLSRIDYGEADRIISVFTPKRGKLRVIAKGVRRPQSRLGPHLEYFSRCSLMLTKGRDLDIVTGAEMADPHLALRTDLDAFGHASHIVELVNRLTQDRQESEPLYDLLARSLRLLCDGIDAFAVTRHFELALLSILGYQPNLYRCVSCEEEVRAVPNPLSPRLGGVLCERCRSLDASAPILSVNAQKYLRVLDRQGLSSAVRLQLDGALKQELEDVLGVYLRHVSERDLTSLRIWHQLREQPVGVPSDDSKISPSIPRRDDSSVPSE